MPRATPILLILAAASLVATFVLHELTGFGNDAFDAAFAEWFQPIGFLACGLATLLACREPPRGARAVGPARHGTRPLRGRQLLLTTSRCGDLASPPFPSLADGLWLALYPLSFAAIAILVRHRFSRLPAGVWLDGVIGGTVVAAVAAALLLEPVFDADRRQRRRERRAAGLPARRSHLPRRHRRRLAPERAAAVVGSGRCSARASPCSRSATASTSSRRHAARGRPAGCSTCPTPSRRSPSRRPPGRRPRGSPPATAALATTPLMPIGFALVAVALTVVAVVGRSQPAGERS